jgi:hypothetical protein
LRLEILTAVKMSMLVFLVVTLRDSEDGGTMFLRNDDIYFKFTRRYNPEDLLSGYFNDAASSAEVRAAMNKM